jgi:tRNA(Ile)-lysidine synthase
MLTPKHFASLIRPFLREKMAVAVSGGSDSMALTLLLKEFCDVSFSYESFVALTVDHQLRPFSGQEAETVHSWLVRRGIEHHTLIWHHDPLVSQIEEKARQARYFLLFDFCQQNDISILLTAHHAQDQMETFLMRLSRGSGLRGINAIRPVSDYNGLTIGRPLLTILPDQLKTTLTERFQQPHIHDESNESSQFERVRWRKALPLFASLGLTPESVMRTLAHLQKIESQREQTALEFLQNFVVFSGDTCFFPKDAFLILFPYVAQRVIMTLLKKISQKESPISQRLLESVYEKMRIKTFKGTTASGCWIRLKKGQCFFISQENRKMN